MNDSNPKYHFLLLSNTSFDAPWKRVLQNALSPMGRLHILSEDRLVQTPSLEQYVIIIIDASSVADVVVFIRRLRTRDDDVHLVVATASPTWQRARAILLAGASDYIRKSLDENKIRAQIQAVLERSFPPANSFRTRRR